MDERKFKNRNRRSFLILLASYAAGFAGWRWLFSRAPNQGTPWPLRSAFRLNEKITSALNDSTHLNQNTSLTAKGADFRQNGDIGIDSDLDLASWQLQIDNPNATNEDAPLNMGISDLQALTQTSYQVEFRCIEGWSAPVGYEGVRFSDFLDTMQKRAPHWGDLRSYAYVGLETPDGEYYTSIDMQSMLHPQTVLALKLNGGKPQLRTRSPLALDDSN